MAAHSSVSTSLLDSTKLNRTVDTPTPPDLVSTITSPEQVDRDGVGPAMHVRRVGESYSSDDVQSTPATVTDTTSARERPKLAPRMTSLVELVAGPSHGETPVTSGEFTAVRCFDANDRSNIERALEPILLLENVDSRSPAL